MLNPMRCLLVEYGLSLPPLFLQFELGPESISRTRTVQINLGNAPGTHRGFDFTTPNETSRVAMGVQVQPEEFSLEILLDATDRMNAGDPIAVGFGVEPQLDTLRTMLEPKVQGPAGLNVLASLGQGGQRAFQRNETASVLLLVWGTHILPVFLTSVQVNEVAHLPTLIPYRARVTLGFRVIEGNNPFYQVEQARQLAGAALSLVDSAATAVTVNFGGGF